MKLYIGNRELADPNIKKIEEPSLIKYIAEDGECEEIHIDGVLRSLSVKQIPEFMVSVKQKARLNSILTIRDIDFDMIHYLYDRSGNIKELNELIFKQEKPLYSLQRVEDVLQLVLQLGYEVLSKNVEGLEFIIVLRNIA